MEVESFADLFEIWDMGDCGFYVAWYGGHPLSFGHETREEAEAWASELFGVITDLVKEARADERKKCRDAVLFALNLSAIGEETP